MQEITTILREVIQKKAKTVRAGNYHEQKTKRTSFLSREHPPPSL